MSRAGEIRGTPPSGGPERQRKPQEHWKGTDTKKIGNVFHREEKTVRTLLVRTGKSLQSRTSKSRTKLTPAESVAHKALHEGIAPLFRRLRRG